MILLDVFFLSNGESNADENWQRLHAVCPRAKRIDGVKGLFQAHQACAQASSTENFWVVDADAWILDGFDFSYVPQDVMHWDHAEKDCVLIWPARNPVNGLEYGYGGIKMFPRRPFLDNRAWNIDLSTTIATVSVLMSPTACETRFNASAESAWIGAFRECAKLASLHSVKQRIRLVEDRILEKFDGIETTIKQNATWTKEQRNNYRNTQHIIILESTKQARDLFSHWSEIEQNLDRYGAWTRYGWHEKNGRYVILGAREGARYGLINSDDVEAMNKINDWHWLKDQYQRHNHA